jgi:2,4-dienoyl-CoA reductase-like NADH-dependent reductase (Old Yellow Enzyme family)
MSQLFTPIRLGGLELQNRVVIAPMCQYSADHGRATSWHVIHLGHLALSGAGLLILEATAVVPEGRITPGDLGLWDDDTERALAEALRAVRAHSAMPLGIQLAHAGRKSSTDVPWEGGKQIPPGPVGWRTDAPSDVPHAAGEVPPHALDEAGLARIRDGFAEAARRADRLGLDLIELHAAHGYLLHQFLSPIANRRTDAYGGPLENRLRFPLEVFEAVRAAVPGKPVGVRVSATDWVEGGWDIEGTLAFGKALAERGCDFLDVSSGGVSPDQKIALKPGYQVPFAARVKAEVGLPTMAVGLITEPEQAEAVVAEGEADMVALARGILYDPRWPWHAAATLGAQVRAPQQYWRSQPRELKTLFAPVGIGQR